VTYVFLLCNENRWGTTE